MTKKYLDLDGLSRYDSKIKNEIPDISGKVDKETGKGLSTNDFTDTYKDNVDDNTSARHTHSNKYILDQISSTSLNVWNRITYIAYALGLNTSTYDTSSTYSKGDLVIHSYRIYECNTNNTTGTWDDSKWDLVPIIVND